MAGTIRIAGRISGEVKKRNEIKGNLSFPTERTSPGSYAALPDKPMINGEVLEGDKSFEDLGDSPLTNLQIKAIFDNVFNK